MALPPVPRPDVTPPRPRNTPPAPPTAGGAPALPPPQPGVPAAATAPRVAMATPIAPPPGAQPPAAQEGDQVIEYAPKLGFFQQPWVQNGLPFVSSLLLHAGIVVLGLLAAKAVDVVVNNAPVEEQIIVPDSELVEEGAPGGVQTVGLGSDQTRAAAPDEFPEGAAPDGWAPKPGENSAPSLEGGGAGDASTDPVIGLGPGGGFGKGSGVGGGKGAGQGSGSGEGSGPLAPFGTPGGGGIGPKSRFMGVGGNARKVIFLCDATGTMLPVFDDLRRELVKAVTGLKSIQGFNICFFQEDAYSILSKDGLLLATPENKAKSFKFLEDNFAQGRTNPIPAIRASFAQKPELIYVLTDGFDAVGSFQEVVDEFRKLNATKQTRVNTLWIQSNSGGLEPELEAVLKQIAQENGGKFKKVEEKDLQ